MTAHRIMVAGLIAGPLLTYSLLSALSMLKRLGLLPW